jgi:hypothetical protein
MSLKAMRERIVVGLVAVAALVVNMKRKTLHHLREKELSGVHGSPLRTLLDEDGCISR